MKGKDGLERLESWILFLQIPGIVFFLNYLKSKSRFRHRKYGYVYFSLPSYFIVRLPWSHFSERVQNSISNLASHKNTYITHFCLFFRYDLKFSVSTIKKSAILFRSFRIRSCTRMMSWWIFAMIIKLLSAIRACILIC